MGVVRRASLLTPTFAVTTAATLSYFVSNGFVNALLSRFVEGELGGNGVHIGTLTSIFAAVAVLSRRWSTRLGAHIGLGRAMAAGGLVATIGMLLTASTGSVWLLMPVRALSGIAEGVVFVSALSVI